MQGLRSQEINNVCYCKKCKSFPGKVRLYIKLLYIQFGVVSFLQNHGERGCVAYPSSFSAPRPSHCTDTVERTGVWIRSPMLLKGFLWHDREGPKIWCLIRSTFHKIKSEDSVLWILTKIIFIKWRNIDWFPLSNGELSTTQKIWGSQVIIPKNIRVCFVCTREKYSVGWKCL